MHAPDKQYALISESEYREAIAEFDRLWSSSAPCETRGNMDRLIRLIEAYESLHAISERFMYWHKE